MVQALLADRFKLAVHRVTKEEEVYALVVAKSGLKLKEAADVPAASADPDAPPAQVVVIGGIPTRMTRFSNAEGSGFTLSNPRIGTARQTTRSDRSLALEAPTTTFAGLADLLAWMGRLPEDVVDMTGIAGRYPVNLEVSQNEVFAAVNTALLKLGLQLERRKAPVETLFVDHVEKIPTGN